MKTKNYGLLLTGQFLGAFGDNAVLAVILGPMMAQLKAGKITPEEQSIANIFYTSLLFVPYLLFATLAGYVNDRYPKTTWLAGGNALKLLGTALASLSIWSSSIWLAIGYAMVGVGACMYSPAKYGILPEILPTARLVKANGTVELLTLVAILFGNIVGALMVDRMSLPMCYGLVAGIYAASLMVTLLMKKTPASPTVKLSESTSEFLVNLKDLFSKPRVVKILVGTSLFWICGAMLKMNFQPWGQQVLKFERMLDIALLGLWLSIGVMIGSVLAGQLYKIGELHASRRYGMLLSGCLVALGLVNWMTKQGLNNPKPVAIGILIVAGLMAGLFLIPLNAALQAEAHHGKLGKTIATQNALENTAMLGGSLFAYFNVRIGFDPSQLFLALAVLVAIVAACLGFKRGVTSSPSTTTV